MSKTVTTEMTIQVPLAQLWTAFKDLERLMPRMMPGFIESAEYLEGDGSVGSIREIKFGKGVPLSSSKELLEKVDDLTHVYTYRILESDLLKAFRLYRVTWEFGARKAEEGSGTDVKWTIEYIAIGEETPAKTRDSAIGLMKRLETYLVTTQECSQGDRKSI